jgi:hypothetical protein
MIINVKMKIVFINNIELKSIFVKKINSKKIYFTNFFKKMLLPELSSQR